uniref:Polysaccharide pyruvyl transferase domain-containing protein n=1 Tax=Chromera velia CCMP2878 TaxID=1169474 RepID=A0A0K6S6T7_9ALVE|eukprot:Cvel_18832.t2-p1 / transcript=Cvel_18832.t2 / gene=Cvel_18832 / organism=Chromera_velia_CCMP2878 / gene_product=Pyruvyl transferase 1, putative / transcript_product=Pyruvyl transferase 1, putative / location=Cvel_scaffold1582:14562-15668(-) / protein_length=189 / sequence_SO=supercontig / SO=protein_coding / is_pseudo=false
MQFFEAASGGKGALTEAAVFGLADHENKGDAAINYGQAAILRSHDLKVSTFCASTPKFPCDFNEAERKIRETETNGGRVIVVATGGGNFGDLWGRYAEEREELIRRFPDFPILFFPQTVHFSNETNANRHLTMLASHPRLTVLARDVQSLEFLSASPLSETQGGNATLGLVPDSAEALHPKVSADFRGE